MKQLILALALLTASGCHSYKVTYEPRVGKEHKPCRGKHCHKHEKYVVIKLP